MKGELSNSGVPCPHPNGKNQPASCGRNTGYPAQPARGELWVTMQPMVSNPQAGPTALSVSLAGALVVGGRCWPTPHDDHVMSAVTLDTRRGQDRMAAARLWEGRGRMAKDKTRPLLSLKFTP